MFKGGLDALKEEIPFLILEQSPVLASFLALLSSSEGCLQIAGR